MEYLMVGASFLVPWSCLSPKAVRWPCLSPRAVRLPSPRAVGLHVDFSFAISGGFDVAVEGLANAAVEGRAGKLSVVEGRTDGLATVAELAGSVELELEEVFGLIVGVEYLKLQPPPTSFLFPMFLKPALSDPAFARLGGRLAEPPLLLQGVPALALECLWWTRAAGGNVMEAEALEVPAGAPRICDADCLVRPCVSLSGFPCLSMNIRDR